MAIPKSDALGRTPTPTDRELQIKAETLTCRHFNGVHHNECKAGVNYRALVGPPALGCMTRIPCVVAFEPKGGPVADCPKRERYSPEEAEHNVAAGEAAMARHMTAFRVVHDDAKAKGLKRGYGGNSAVICPVCQKQIRYSVASVNGHVHAACETKGCVRWME